MESLLLFRRALPSPTMCRFIPALSVHAFPCLSVHAFPCSVSIYYVVHQYSELRNNGARVHRPML
jgi:hypothetical protein